MYILGISAFYHDSAAALLYHGVPVACVQEERFSRRKNDPSFPKRAAKFCLRQAGIEASELEWVVFYEKPLRKFERILVSQLRAFPRGGKAFSRAMFQWLGDRLWLKNRLATELDVDPERILFTEHHRSHAASAFYPSPFEEAAILTADGVGEWATTCLSEGRDGSITTLAEVHFPYSLGLFYSAITAFLGFEVNEGEQKVLAMASFGEPRFAEKLDALFTQAEDGSFELDLRPFRFHYDPERSFGPELEDILGPARLPGSGAPEPRHFDIAASLQQVTEAALLRLLEELHRRSPSDNLCLAGGVALNVVANTVLLEKGPFRRLFVPPAPGDAGGALGAALEIHHRLGSGERSYRQRHVNLGENVLAQPREGHRHVPDEGELISEVVRLLTEGKTVGWVEGRFEWGPRSLGHRAILADPRDAEVAERINRRIKRRETFRPFAPAVPIADYHRYFEIPEGGEMPARFMLVAVPTREDAKGEIPAVVHVDGTARAHLVDPEELPRFHRLLEAFGEATGVPVLLETSLNLRGEPIARGEADALAVYDRSGLDALVVEDRLYVKE
ncbi:MAG: hypothetical protein MI919_41795 [Holophagales bacterium]|nr:hypothetical protein [Holophagales bacterium]